MGLVLIGTITLLWFQIFIFRDFKFQRKEQEAINSLGRDNPFVYTICNRYF